MRYLRAIVFSPRRAARGPESRLGFAAWLSIPKPKGTHQMHVISTVSRQWAIRPSDQRFVSLDDLAAHVERRRVTSRTQFEMADRLRLSTDGTSLVIGDHERPYGELNHWAFGQLCAMAGASSSYLRTLPAAIAEIPLQWSLETNTERRIAQLLVRGNADEPGALSTVGAFTSETYGRIWDAEVVQAIREHIGPNWKVPGASYASRDPKRATTLYASDRDVFLFLVDESRPIEVGSEKLFRGFYAWNSEVGSTIFGLATFLYRHVCDNRNIWGPANFSEIRIRHTAGAPRRFMRQAVPILNEYVNAGTAETVATVKAAQSKELGKDKASVVAWLRARKFTLEEASEAYDSAERDALNPRSLWGVVQGLTHNAHEIKHANDRVDVERRAGRLLDLAA
jgi:hypothetical protein